jgi:hypothetical protein
MSAPLHARISDFSPCSQCVSEAQKGFAAAYLNAGDALFGICKRHATKWYVSRALLPPAIPDLTEYPDLVAVFDPIEPKLQSGANAQLTPDRPRAARQGRTGTRKPVQTTLVLLEAPNDADNADSDGGSPRRRWPQIAAASDAQSARSLQPWHRHDGGPMVTRGTPGSSGPGRGIRATKREANKAVGIPDHSRRAPRNL